MSFFTPCILINATELISAGKEQLSITDVIPAYLFKLEYMLIKVILQVLIGVVDTKLLKTVPGKILKTEDVQHTY